jgi:predicted RNase H-like HicB family nuclease
MRYELIIYWSKAGGSFIVEVPELPGGMADGASDEEAVAHAQAVIQEWSDTARSLGRPIPEPRGKLACIPPAGRNSSHDRHTTRFRPPCGKHSARNTMNRFASDDRLSDGEAELCLVA